MPHPKLPTCELIRILAEKGGACAGENFDFMGTLDRLRERVSGEVRFISLLFPEYTPHDVEHHLTRLFYVADILLERERFERMNVAELFVLACGLYGHDWGMAVSLEEREEIISTILASSASGITHALLPDEGRRFRRFLADNLRGATPSSASDISDEHWREYVRQTHALRSAARAKAYFEAIDPGLGEAVARVCEGHWLDFEILQDHKRYPRDYAVMRERVNLAAIAIYVRLVDLLDIGRDRTPYVIWKFVAPRNRTSKLEWEKHRALQPVSLSTYMSGRTIVVDGSTDDHEVYAALEDLRLYCERQVRGCTDLLARIRDPHHQLDIYHLEWRVNAIGFDPLPVQFEFDRDRIFEILSSQIYQGDAHVFLRELLQNSIDAIRSRAELIRSKTGVSTTSFGLIRVQVEHKTDGDARIVWTDDGVGMDIYVVRNYLAVAGRSFYMSEDFERQGLQFDPISRFGIGVLSCFMIADDVEIETYKDPYASLPGDPLAIKIPSVGRQFRVEKLAPHGQAIGTRITVDVDGRRLPKDLQRLDVTRYLKAVAGFVPFPIWVTEEGFSTVIVHPSTVIDVANDHRFRGISDMEVFRTELDYSPSELFLPQDRAEGEAEFEVRSYDVAHDLGLTGYDGAISYLRLRDSSRLVSRTFVDAHYIAAIEVVDPHPPTRSRIIRWPRRSFGLPDSGEEERWSLSALANPEWSIFYNGILVPKARSRNTAEDEAPFYQHALDWPPARTVLNLQSKKDIELNIARTELDDHVDWFAPIRKALRDVHVTEFLAELGETDESKQVHQFGLFVVTNNVDGSFLRDVRVQNVMPVPVLTPGGTIKILPFGSLATHSVAICPYILQEHLGRSLLDHYLMREHTGLLRDWAGDDAFVIGPFYERIADGAIEAALSATYHVLESSHVFSRINLLSPGVSKDTPLVQEVWEPRDDTSRRSIDSICQSALSDLTTVTPHEISRLARETRFLWNKKFVGFPTLGPQPFSLDDSMFNINHPVVDLIVRSLARYVQRQQPEKSDDEISGRLRDAIARLTRHEFPVTAKINGGISALQVAAHQAGVPQIPTTLPKIDPKRDIWSADTDKIRARAKGIPFGQPLAI